MSRNIFLLGLAWVIIGGDLAAGQLVSPPHGGGGSGGSGSVFAGSTSITVASSATPAFSLADISSKSPIVFNFTPVVNVTSPTITNKTAGANFFIRVTTDGTHTWSWNGIIADGICPVYTDAAATTTVELAIDADGSTVHGLDCAVSLNVMYIGPTGAAPSVTPTTSGNEDCRPVIEGINCLESDGVHRVMTRTGTNGHLGSYNASSILADSGIVAANVTQTIASGTLALATGAISSASCTAAQTAVATGTLTTDVVTASFNGDPTGVTGYVPLTTGMLTIILYPTADTFNVKVCNNTNASITPGAITLNWAVRR